MDNKAAKGRYPGDVKDYGTFGHNSNYHNLSNSPQPYYEYQKTDFAPPFDSGEFIPDCNSAPFVDLYTESVIDFKPLGNTMIVDKTSETKGVPTSRVLNAVYYFTYTGSNAIYQGTPAQNKYFPNGMVSEGATQHSIVFTFPRGNATNGLDPKILKSVDEKLDDREHWSGKIKSSCYGKKPDGTASDTAFGYTDYDYAIDEGKKCDAIFYAL